MSDLEKLLDEGDEFERSLLESAIDPDEERAREQRTLAALGLGGPAGPGPGDGGASGAGAAIGKWLALAAAGGALVLGGIALRPKPTPAPPPTSPAVVEPRAPSASVAPELIEVEPVPSPVASAPVASAPRPIVSRAAPSASALLPEKTSASTLAEEIRVLDRARAALRAGDSKSARAELDRYDRAFPFGSLGPEAKALRARVNKTDGSKKIP